MKFDKEIYALGFEGCRQTLKAAGFKVVHDEVVPVPETSTGIVETITQQRPNVGAVFIDFSINFTFMQLQRCIQYVTDNGALFFVGGVDSKIPVRGVPLIGAIHFARIVEEFTEKTAIKLSKPSKDFHDLIEEKLGPFDAKRVLFLGDSVDSDMKFASEFGYQKLLPLTGYTTEEDLKHWKYEEELRPDYVADSVADISTVIQNLGLNESEL